MINAYDEINRYSGTDWDDFLERASLLSIFEPVLERYKDAGLRKSIITFIARVYTRTSPHIVEGMEWTSNKKKVFESLLIHQDIFHELVRFENKKALTDIYDSEEYAEKEKDIDALKLSINRWLNFQNSDTFVMLCVMRDVKIEMQVSATGKIRKSGGEIDYDQKFKNTQHALQLRTMISDLEKELIENDDRLKEGVRELRKETKKSDTFSIESSIK